MAANKPGTKNKKKPTSRQAAAARIAERRDAPQVVRVPSSEKLRSQGQFPQETPLTGERRLNTGGNRPGPRDIPRSGRKSASHSVGRNAR